MTASRHGLRLLGRAAFLAALAACALWAVGWAAERDDAPPKGTASELDLVPADGGAVISFHVAELWNHAAFKGVREKLAKEAPDLLERATKQTGVAPEDVDRITVLLPDPTKHVAALVVTTTRPYDAKKVAAALVTGGTEETVNGRTVVARTGGPALAFLTDRTFTFGDAEPVHRVAALPAGARDGPLTPALREASKHCIVAGLDAEALAKAVPNDLPPDAAPFKPLFKAKNAVLTVDLGDELKADLRVSFGGEADAKQGEEAVNAALDMARAGFVQALAQLEKQRELSDVIPQVKEAQAALRAARVERNGSTVEASASLKIDVEKTAVGLLDAVQKVRDAASRMQSSNNLKQMGIAMHSFHDANGFMPTNVYDKSDKPLLSWRVQILPYIEQGALYNQFKLDEPWDSPNNIKLLDKMPMTYTAPGQDPKELKDHLTRYQGFAGKGALFAGAKRITMVQITDGLSNTIMVAEAAKGVPWSKPDDIPFDAGKLAPNVGGLSERTFNALMCDGAVHALPLAIKEETLRALITPNGGEVIPDLDK